jgi:hypothetical protein
VTICVTNFFAVWQLPQKMPEQYYNVRKKYDFASHVIVCGYLFYARNVYTLVRSLFCNSVEIATTSFSDYLSLYLFLSTSLSVHLSVSLSISLCQFLSRSLSLHRHCPCPFLYFCPCLCPCSCLCPCPWPCPYSQTNKIWNRQTAGNNNFWIGILQQGFFSGM